MRKKKKYLYDECSGGTRIVIYTDTFNYIVIQGNKDLPDETFFNKSNLKNYYTSIRSLIQGMFEKRVKTHLKRLTTVDLNKSIESAYKDVIDLSKAVEGVTIKRT